MAAHDGRHTQLAAHYHFEARPVAVARGNEKGRVERAIRYVRDAFFAARKYADVADLNRQADSWCDGASADRKWIEDRSRTVRDAFDDERGRLLNLPADQFPVHERVEVEIGKTPYARFDLNDYSVPHDRTQRSLTVLADLETVRIVEGQNDVVATHSRCWDRGQQVEIPEHLERLAAEKKRSREHRGLDRLAKAAPSSQAFLRCLADRGQNLGSNDRDEVAVGAIRDGRRRRGARARGGREQHARSGEPRPDATEDVTNGERAGHEGVPFQQSARSGGSCPSAIRICTIRHAPGGEKTQAVG